MSTHRTHHLWNCLLLAGVLFVVLAIAQQPLWSWWLAHQSTTAQADWEFTNVSGQGRWPSDLKPGENWPATTSEIIVYRLFGYEHTHASGLVSPPPGPYGYSSGRGSGFVDLGSYYTQEIYTSGWPLMAHRVVVAEGQTSSGPIKAERSELIWSGLLINAALGALVGVGIFLLLTRALAIWRAKRRSRKKLCPACAYPRGRSPICTECGATLPPYVRLTLSPEQRRRRVGLFMLVTFTVLALAQVPFWRWWSRQQGAADEAFQLVPQAGSDLEWPASPPNNGERWPPPKKLYTQRSFGRVNDMAVAGFDPALGSSGPIPVAYSMTIMRIGWPCEVLRLSSIRSPLITADPPDRKQVRLIGILINAALAWLVVMTLTLMPLTLLRNFRARWRTAHNLCPACAHLRGRSPVCSECGHVFSPPATPN